MRRISSTNADVFRPTGQLRNEIELASNHADRVIAILTEQLSEERQRRIDEVLSHRTRRLSVAIEGVHDPHNTAAIMRSADALGVQTVHVIENGVSFLSSRKVTQGAHKWIDLGIWREAREFVEGAHGMGQKVLVAKADGDRSINELDPSAPQILVFGNEAEGISDKMTELADGSFKIPMVGFVESFNVSVASAISMSALRRGRTGDLEPGEFKLLKARWYLRAVKTGYAIVLERLRRENEESSQLREGECRKR